MSLIFLEKIYFRRVNEFDCLAPILLLLTVTRPYLFDFGYALEIVAAAFVIAALAKRSGAGRKGTLFISTTFFFGDLMVKHRLILDGGIEDVDSCAMITFGLVCLFGLGLSITYMAMIFEEPQTETANSVAQSEARLWLVVVLIHSAVCAGVAAHTCDQLQMTQTFTLLVLTRLAFLVISCIACGEHENQDIETY